jgi:GAF domain-containing protein
MIRHKTAVLLEENVRQQQAAMGIINVGPEPQSWLGVPIIAGDEVLGVMAAQSYTTPRAFSITDQNLLTAIANQAAITIQNVRQFEETQRRARREQTIREITERIRTAANLEQLLKITATELSRRFDAEYALVDLGLEATNQPIARPEANGSGHT